MEPSFSWFLVFAVDPLGTDPLLLGLEPTRVHHIYLSNLNSNPSTIGSSMHKPLREFFAKHLAQLGCADLVMFIFPVPGQEIQAKDWSSSPPVAKCCLFSSTSVTGNKRSVSERMSCPSWPATKISGCACRRISQEKDVCGRLDARRSLFADSCSIYAVRHELWR